MIIILVNIFIWLIIRNSNCSPFSSSAQRSIGERVIDAIGMIGETEVAPRDCQKITSEQDCIAHSQCKPLLGSICGYGLQDELDRNEKGPRGTAPAPLHRDSTFVYLGCIPKSSNFTKQQQQQQQQQRQLPMTLNPNRGVCARQGMDRPVFWFPELKTYKELPDPWFLDFDCRECLSLIPSLSVLILAWNELESLENSLKSWKKNGLLSYAYESIIYFQQLNEEKRELAERFGIKVIGSEENTNIAFALDTLISEAKSDTVLFLEKDWMLIEPFPKVKEQLEAGMHLLQSHSADFVKFRSRYDGGWPNYAQSFYQGQEDTVYQSQPNLMCNFYHWVDDPDFRWPDKFTRCLEEPRFYCIDSYYCNWTNNPCMFLRSWWFQYFSKLASSLPRNHKHNWEGILNSNQKIWNQKGFTVAEGNGLFKHVEINER